MMQGTTVLTQLMRQLLTHDRQTDGDARDFALCEGCSDANAVEKIVETVTKDNHPSNCANSRSLTRVKLHNLMRVMAGRMWFLWNKI